MSNHTKRRLTLQIYGKTTYKVALHKVAGAIFPPTATEAWEKAGGKINFFNTKTHKTMRLRNKILAMAVVAVAGFNTYLANDIRVQRNELSLLNLENIAEADEVVAEEINNITNTAYEPKATTAVCYKTVVETKTVTNEGNGSVGISSTSVGGKRSKTTTITTTTNYYVYPCLGSQGTSCTPTYVN